MEMIEDHKPPPTLVLGLPTWRMFLSAYNYKKITDQA